MKYETLLKLYFGGVEDRTVTIRNLELFEENIKQNLEILKSYKSNLEKVLDEEDQLYYYLTVTFGIDIYEAYLKWCTKSKKLLKNEAKLGKIPGSIRMTGRMYDRKSGRS